MAHPAPPRRVPRSCRLLVVLFSFLAALLSLSILTPPQSEVFGYTTLGASKSDLWPLSIDYPLNSSIFPPGITPPTFLWRDPSASSWQISIVFSDDAKPIQVETSGQRMQVGQIDPACVSSTNELPRLTSKQAASWTWSPDPVLWTTVQQRSSSRPAVLTITGYNSAHQPSSQGRVTFSTSVDPVGAPIFYRDVPLMPSEGANGTVQPLSPTAIHLINWRTRDIREPESHTVLRDMPTCANCHSFSGDGKTMGIDVDGPANDKGLYAIVPVERHISIQNKNVVQWNTDGQAGKARVGFMSQVSPDGRYVLSTFAGSTLDISNTYYVTNFKDYRFLQVFYPTRGILEWYDRSTGKRQPLPGADDPRYVQTDGVWSPDGKYIVFARAEAKDPYPEGQPKALHANDPNETQIQYDLYRVPFNHGRGGTPEPIAGASHNGMSNNFPKVSPDGRWIVYVQCRNGQLMRPDSQLYIVPSSGGAARRLEANTSLMNSWHSFSPNGRWLVFSSKSRSFYTQMYLTHIDEQGNSSPAIYIDNATAANRAVNLPEFVNTAGNGIEDIGVPAVTGYKLVDDALQAEAANRPDQALALWSKAVALDAENERAQTGLGISLYVHGETEASFQHLREALRLNPLSAQNHFVLGRFMLEQGDPREALPELEAAIRIRPHFEADEEALARTYEALGDNKEALSHWRKAQLADSTSASAMTGAAWLLATSPDGSLRNGAEAVRLAENAAYARPDNPEVLDTLAAAYAEEGLFSRASSTEQGAWQLAEKQSDKRLQAEIRAHLAFFQKGRPFHQEQGTIAEVKTHAGIARTR